jgi:hypothetical protein
MSTYSNFIQDFQRMTAYNTKFLNSDFNWDAWTDEMILFFLELISDLERNGISSETDEADDMEKRYLNILGPTRYDIVIDQANEIYF